MPLAIGDVVETKIATHQADQVGINVRHWRVVSTTGTSVEVGAVAFFLSTELAPLYKACMANTATYYGVRAQKISPIPMGAAALSLEGNGVGSGGAAAMPAQVSGIISFYTALAGRRNRGRCYVPFPSEDANDNVTNRPFAGYQTSLSDLAGALGTNLACSDGTNGATLEPVIWSRASRLAIPIVDWNARARWATQRSRGNYGRPNPLPPF